MLTGHRTREFNPGPASRSRKKRSQVGAKGLPRKRAVRVPWFETDTRTQKFDAKKRARKAIGARGVKTNARRTRKAVRVPHDLFIAQFEKFRAAQAAALTVGKVQTTDSTAS